MTTSSTDKNDLTRPSPEMTEYYIRRARRLRAEFYAQMFRRLGRGITAAWQSANLPWRSGNRAWREQRSAH